jgi:membrane protein YdbS with pleckstrin-like domain
VQRRLDPAIRWVWLAGGLATVLVPLVITLVLAFGDWLPGWVTVIAGLVTLVVALAGVALPFLRYRAWSYQLREDDLVIRYGVVRTVERWIPRKRIQYVDLVGGPIERSLGLRTLVAYTAGSGLLSVSVPGLPEQEAATLRSELLSWAGSAEEEAAADVEEPPG